MCVIGSKAFIANEVIENEPSSAVGEWMSGVITSSSNDSSTACLILDLKVEELTKRLKVEIIYQDVNNTIEKTSLYDYDVGAKDNFERKRFGTFELHLNNVLKYQVRNVRLFIIYALCLPDFFYTNILYFAVIVVDLAYKYRSIK